MKKLSFLLAFLLLLSFAQAKEISVQDAFSFLNSKSNNGNFNDNIVDTSLAVLAFDRVSQTTSREISFIKSQMNVNNCWPKASCRVEDSAFAILALETVGEATTDNIDWLKGAQTPLSSGRWLLQIETADSGTCSSSFTNGVTFDADINVQFGNFPSCFNSTQFDLNVCLSGSPINNNPFLNMQIDCSGLTDALISVVFNSGNSFFISEEASNRVADLVINNGCYGITSKASCNYITTAWANLALASFGSEVNSLAFLSINYDNSNTLHNSLLFLSTGRDSFLEELVARQKADGSWDGSVFNTAFAVLALRETIFQDEVADALEWLGTKQKTDGSFGTVKDTAAVLYALPDSLVTSIVLPSIDSSGICNFDNECDAELGEDSDNCPDDCPVDFSVNELCFNGIQDLETQEQGIDCGGLCPKSCEEDVCVPNDNCEVSEGENSVNCPVDCSCGDNVCDNLEDESACPEDCEGVSACNNDGFCDFNEDSVNCPNDCALAPVEEEPEEPGSPWLIIILVLLVLGGFFYYFYFMRKGKGFDLSSLFKKKPKGPAPRNPYSPTSTKTSSFGMPSKKPAQAPGNVYKPNTRRVTKSAVERELDESLNEARKLLKKK